MKVLVWQWGRFGSGPRLAVLLADALRSLPDTDAILSLSVDAEIFQCSPPPKCELPVPTYNGMFGFVRRAVGSIWSVRRLAKCIKHLAPDVAICTMPGPLDLLMARALRCLKLPFVVLVHEVGPHPGDGIPLQFLLQRALCTRADAIGALSTHVANGLRQTGMADTPARPLLRLSHTPVGFGVPAPRPWPDKGMRLLFFGRLLQYKGLDLLAEALTLAGRKPGLEVRVVGAGPETAALDALRSLPDVTVENRWVPENEITELLEWSDALILPYREASQSGVAAAALASGRRVLATDVGGLAEQLRGYSLALVCEPNAESLAHGLQDLMDLQPAKTAVPLAIPDLAWQDLAATLREQLLELVARVRGPVKATDVVRDPTSQRVARSRHEAAIALMESDDPDWLANMHFCPHDTDRLHNPQCDRPRAPVEGQL